MVRHINPELVESATRKRRSNDLRAPLLAWAQEVVAVHRTFRSAFLPGTLSTYARKGSTHLWMLHAQGPAFARMLKERIAAFVGGVEWGQRLRNVREFADVMEGLQSKF